MTIRSLCLTALCVFLCGRPSFAASQPASPLREAPITADELAQGFRNRTLLAKPRAGVSSDQLASWEQANGVTLRNRFDRFGGLRVVEIPAAANVSETIAALKNSGLYEYAEPDFIKIPYAQPNDPRFGEQWALANNGQSQGISGADIDARTAWDIRNDASDIIVAVLDTGIRATHEDLAANMWRNPGETPGNNVDDDGNGYVDDVHGINSLVAKGSADSGNPDDDQGHGTSVAGMIGAVGNNARGVAGVAWKVKLMALKFDDADGVLGAGGYISNEIECIDYAIAKGAKVINISYGSKSYSQSELEALRRARDNGIIIVAAAGNDGQPNEKAVSYPASYLLDNLVSVANSTRNDTLADSSTHGAITDLAAPGEEVLTTARESDTAYRTASGTSLASPVVAGAFALMRAQFPADNHRTLINRVLRATDPLQSFSGKVLTGGRLNLQKALSSTDSRPFNDDFAQRAVLAGDSLLVRGSSVGATKQTGEPDHALAGSNSIWYSWTAGRSGTVSVDTSGSGFDTLLAVYTGTNGAALVPVASNDNADGTTSRVTFTASAGTTYQIAVDGKNGAFGMISLGLGFTPANDDWINAAPLSGTSAQAEGTIINATRQVGEVALHASSFIAQGKTVWYRWTAPKSGYFTVGGESDAFDVMVGVFQGAPISAANALDIYSSAASFQAVSGTAYYFGIDTSSSTSGSFTLSLLEAYAAIEIGGSVSSSPTILDDSTILTPSDGGYVFYSSNTDSFFKKLPGSVDVQTIAFPSAGNVFYTATTRGLFATNTSQTIVWEKRFADGISGSPAIASDGTVYVHTDDGNLRAYTSSGTEKWTASVPGVSYSSPSIGSDGTVYIGSSDRNVYAITSGGALRWKFATSDEVYASPSLGSDGTLYVGDLGGRFYAINSSGSQKWAYTAGGDISSSAAIAPDGTIYFGSYDHKLYALTAEGALKWTYSTGDEIRASSPAIDAQGTVYIGSYDKKLHAVNSNGTVKQLYPTGGAVRSSPALWNGNVVFGSNDGLVYFLYTEIQPAASAWPMHRQNSLRTGRRLTNTAPQITAQPSSRAVAIGGSTTLSVTAEGQSPLTYQWYLNGAPIPGANQSTYTISNATDASAGSYTVVITNSIGTVTSSAATITVAVASDVGRIINLSARAIAGAEAKTLIVGLAIGGGSGSKELLIRGVGPTLSSNYSVPGALADPKVTVYSGSTALTSNDDWNGDAQLTALTSQVGAFAFANASSKDSALVSSLAPGTYTAHITSNTGASGVALAEFYDATQVFTAGTPRLTNISARSDVGRGADVLIVGFVIGGSTSKTVLIRGVGPTLGTNYGIAGSLADPKIELRKGQSLVTENDNWASSTQVAELQAVMSSVGAFPLATNTKDAAILVTLEPGAYTAVVSGVGDTTGVALAEVYEVQ